MTAQIPNVVAVLLAGGTGIRFGGTDPKQLLSLAGRPVVDYALRTFLMHAAVSQVIVVAPVDRLEAFRELCTRCQSEKPWTVIPGGATRAASTKAALEFIRGRPNCKLLLHDAVRPFVTERIVDECIAALDAADGVDVVIETADTIVKLDLREDFVEEVPSRKRLRRGQTPQAFWSHTLLSAYDGLNEADLSGLTDDCGALLRYNADLRIGVVRGDEKNFKITTPIDLFIAEQTLFFFGEEPKSWPVVHGIPPNPVAVVFGGTSGLGLATAKQLRDIGWLVRGGYLSKNSTRKAFAPIGNAIPQFGKSTLENGDDERRNHRFSGYCEWGPDCRLDCIRWQRRTAQGRDFN